MASDIKRKRLEALIKELEKIRGRHTELVTVYAPAGYNLAKVVEQIRNEQSTAQNIKSKTVRKNVLGALERILQHLKLYRVTPENGLAIFCGNVSEKEGVSDLEIWAVEPPQPLKQRIYRCDQTFILDALKEMVRETEIYGLIVLDKSEADIGLLSGKKIQSLKHMESIVPGKTKAGGWCVHKDTLIPMADGNIIPIKDIRKKLFFAYDFNKKKTVTAKHNHYFKRQSDRAFKIITHQPRIELISTPEHRFFVINENGIQEKQVANLKKGDRLVSVKKINIDGNRRMDSDLAQILGYILGDGCFEKDRITLFDSDSELLEIYKRIAKRILKTNTTMSHREKKNYWQLRIYGRNIVRNLQNKYPEIAISYEKDIPVAILSLRNCILSKFLRGLFDAEGFVNSSSNRIGITMNRERLIRSLQIILLRFGIISSFNLVNSESYAKKQKYTISIDDKDSLVNFSKSIGFSGKKKRVALASIIRKRKEMSRIDQVPIDGRYVRKQISKLRMNCKDVPEAGNMYLLGKRQMSRPIFEKNIIKKLEKRLKELKNPPKDLLELRKLVRIQYKEIASYLGVRTSTVFGNMKNGWNTVNIRNVIESMRMSMIEDGEKILNEFNGIRNSNIISVKIGSIASVEPSGLFYDMEVDKYENFIANGIVIHNSANRYARIREGMLNDFLKKVGDIASAQFKGLKDLKGILVGGSGPVKNMFADGDFLDYEVKGKIIGIIDTSYTGSYGMQETVDRAEDVLEEASIMREKKILDRFFGELEKDSGLAIYGLKETMESLKSGNVDLLLVSEAFDWVKTRYECKCGGNEEKVVRKEQVKSLKCSECKNLPENIMEQDLIDEVVKTAEEMGTGVEMISIDTPKGLQLKELGAIAGILRFKA